MPGASPACAPSNSPPMQLLPPPSDGKFQCQSGPSSEANAAGPKRSLAATLFGTPGKSFLTAHGPCLQVPIGFPMPPCLGKMSSRGEHADADLPDVEVNVLGLLVCNHAPKVSPNQNVPTVELRWPIMRVIRCSVHSAVLLPACTQLTSLGTSRQNFAGWRPRFPGSHRMRGRLTHNLGG